MFVHSAVYIYFILFIYFHLQALIGVTHAQKYSTRNLCKFIDLCQVLLHLYTFRARNRTQLYLAEETCMHVIKIVSFDW